MKYAFFLLWLTLFSTSCRAPSPKDAFATTDSLKSAAATYDPTSPADSTADEEEEPETTGPPDYPGSQQLWAYKFYGFSPDLTYSAFEASGYDDLPWNGMDFCILKVDKNDFASKPYRDRFEGELDDSLRTVLDGLLGKFKLPVKSGFVQIPLHGMEQAAVTIQGGKFNLKLIQTAVGDRRIFELQLIDMATGKVQVLQKDTRLPVSRGEAKRYRLKDAFVQANKIAVMIEYDLESVRDYEQYWNYITKYMMVTGTIL